MGEAFITRRGGGGSAGLNFEVVGGTTRPTNPKENTIWLNTAREITRWDFSAEHPFMVSKTKNFICRPFYDPTVTTNGVAYTDNGDGTVKATGTAIEDATFRLSFLSAAGNAVYLPAGKYFLSGCPAGGSSTTYRVEVKSVASGATLAADYGAGAGFELDAPDVVRCNIVVAKGATVSGHTFKPQLEKGSSATAFVAGDATGQVWISVGTSSATEFNALKKNGIQVYPMAAKLNIDGAWNDITAMSYQSGAWADWIVYAFNHGDTCDGLTGGWVAKARNTNINAVTPTLTISGGVMTVSSYRASALNYFGGTVQTAEKIDMSAYSVVKFHVTEVKDTSGGGVLRIGVADDADSTGYTMNAYLDITAAGDYELDVSSVNTACVIAINPRSAGAAGSTASISINEIILE